jgi:tetratricopeptide (TPR) repeat protein
VTVVLAKYRHRLPGAATAWFAFVLLALPILGVAQAGIQVVADRYSHLACLPLAALAGGAVARQRRPGWALAALALVLTPLTYRQTSYWHDPLTLWERAAELRRDSPQTRAQLGFALFDLERWADAEGHLRFAAEHRKRDVEVLNALAYVRVQRDDLDDAIRLWTRSLEIDPTQEIPRENLRRAGVDPGSPRND